MGNTVYNMWTIEYRKRGLRCSSRTRTTLSNPRSSTRWCVRSSRTPPGELTDIVKSQIIHGPCDLNSNTACIVDGECSKKYPRPFCDETSVGMFILFTTGGTTPILPSSVG